MEGVAAGNEAVAADDEGVAADNEGCLPPMMRGPPATKRGLR
jgi:hypothetical protein